MTGLFQDLSGICQDGLQSAGEYGLSCRREAGSGVSQGEGVGESGQGRVGASGAVNSQEELGLAGIRVGGSKGKVPLEGVRGWRQEAIVS